MRTLIKAWEPYRLPASCDFFRLMPLQDNLRQRERSGKREQPKRGSAGFNGTRHRVFTSDIQMSSYSESFIVFRGLLEDGQKIKKENNIRLSITKHCILTEKWRSAVSPSPQQESTCRALNNWDQQHFPQSIFLFPKNKSLKKTCQSSSKNSHSHLHHHVFYSFEVSPRTTSHWQPLSLLKALEGSTGVSPMIPWMLHPGHHSQWWCWWVMHVVELRTVRHLSPRIFRKMIGWTKKICINVYIYIYTP